MFKAKILVVGPCEVGKTWIANFLAEATESTSGDYHPTQGVRILEFESEGENPSTGKAFKAEVELWDCSGDKKFENCWPALAKDVNGVLLVYSPDNAQKEKELERWRVPIFPLSPVSGPSRYSYFVTQQTLKDSQCLIFGHFKPGIPRTETQPPSSKKLIAVHHVFTSLEDDPESVRDEFNMFLTTILTNYKDSQDREELQIVGSK
ncbi:hypothetical protein EMCRGX_G024114 [Ephydatia muelleri]